MWAAALLAAGAAAGCHAPSTSLDVTVVFDDGQHHPNGLTVSIRVAAQQQVMAATVTAPGGRTLHSGDDFVVLLPDATDGSAAEVDVTTIEQGNALHGQAGATIARAREVAMTVLLGAAFDGGACGMPGDVCCSGVCTSGCCNAGLCVSPGATCASDKVCLVQQGCIACGGDGQPCCAGDQCPTSTRMQCRGGACR